MTIEFLSPSYSISPNPDNHLNSRDPDGDGTEESGTTELNDPPGMTAFENDMVDPGEQRAQDVIDGQLSNGDRDVISAMVYIRDYLGTTQPYDDAAVTKRDDLIQKINDVGMALHHLYFVGLGREYAAGGHQDSIDALQIAADEKCWARFSQAEGINGDVSDKDANWHTMWSRESAFSMTTLLIYEDVVGKDNMVLADRDSGLDFSDPDNSYLLLLHKMEHHLWQWRHNDYSDVATQDEQDEHMRPFMVGHTCFAISHFIERYGNDSTAWPKSDMWGQYYWSDPMTAVEEMLEWLYEEALTRDGNDNRMRVLDDGDGYGVWRYTDRDRDTGGTGITYDLENVISPAYNFLAQWTGEKKYIDYADQMFRTGHEKGYKGAVKQFTQQYYRMYDFFNWRNQF